MLDSFSSDPVALHARLRPEALALVDLATGRRWSYAAFDADIQRAVTVLAARGIGEGDRVAVIARNSAHQVMLQQALLRIGAIFVPLNWRLSLPELERLIEDCAPSALSADGAAPPLPESCRLFDIRDFEAAVDAAEPSAQRRPLTADQTAIILYTSGTSGRPKGALLTPKFLMATAMNFGVLGEVDVASVFLCDSPMFHVIGVVTQLWPPLLFGGACLISSGFDPIATNDRLGSDEFGVTHYFCVPQMAEGLRHAANFDPSRWSTLKALFTGGAPNPPAHVRWWLERGVCMVDGYGMTETGTTLGMPLNAGLIAAKAGGVGLPGPLTEIRLVDEKGDDVADGQPGEVLVRGPNVIASYWNRPDSSEASLTADGWFRTGDLARRDADGIYFIVDRLTDMFISGGENVYPVEIESVLVTHPAVRDAAVIGVADARWGEVGRAYVVTIPGAQITEAELAAHCETQLARYKIPKGFVIVDDLPRTGSGKVMKTVLRVREG